jgi:hypothetical protein
MSDFQQRDGSGQLFRNKRVDSDRHPSHKGTFLLNGVTYEIAAWAREGKQGPFFSLQVQEAGNRPASPARTTRGGNYQPRRRTPGEMPLPPTGGLGRKKPLADDDDIPFQKEWR